MSTMSGSPGPAARTVVAGRFGQTGARARLSALSGWIRLLRIDLKRGGGMWIAPFGVVFAWLTLRDTLTRGAAVWPEITEAISAFSGPLTILAVALGGIAGGRERRREISELASGTPMAAWQRYLSLAASVFLWALGAYALFAAALLAYGALFATWGSPEWGVIVVPVPVLSLGASFGVLIGRGIRDRTAPIIAIALFLLLFVVAFMPSRSTYVLSVFNLNGWFRPVVENAPERPFSVVAQLAWGIGLTGLILGLGIAWERRTASSLVVLVLSALVTMGGAASILRVDDQQPAPTTAMWVAAAVETPREGTCDTSAPIVVCVHPAYEALLPGIAEDVNTWLGPMTGLPGVVDEVYITNRDERFGGPLQPTDRDIRSVNLAWEKDPLGVITRQLWPSGFASTTGGPPNDAVQYVVMTALARDIGVNTWPEWFYRTPGSVDDPAIQDAIDRFAALSPEEQRAWLEANWDDLLHGRLTLGHLP